MLEYQDKVVQEIAACTCDRCQRRMTPNDHDWQERLSIAFRGGFNSIFGDGNEVSIDLCQRCTKETLGAWLQITSGVDRAASEPVEDAVTGSVSLADSLAQRDADGGFDFAPPRMG